jgi:hypothetical protein
VGVCGTGFLAKNEGVMATYLITLLIVGLAGNQIPVPAPLFSDSESIPSASSGSRDLYQTVVARRALSQQPDLSLLNLIVRVRGGRVMVSGTVPSLLTAKRVVQTLEALRGISEVKSDLVVDAKGIFPADRLERIEVKQPLAIEVRRNPVPIANSLEQPVINSSPSSNYRVAGTVSRVLILPQVDNVGAPTPQSSPPREVGLMVAELIQMEPRFGAIRYALVNGILRIDSDVDRRLGMEFAKRASKIPGVQSVQISGE